MGTTTIMYADDYHSWIPPMPGANGVPYSLNYAAGNNSSNIPFMLYRTLQYLGTNASGTDPVVRDMKTHYRCPSDSKFFRQWEGKAASTYYLSYAYWCGSGNTTSKLPPRLVIGRDDPNVCIFADVCVYNFPTSSSVVIPSGTSAHVDHCNVLYLGGHVSPKKSTETQAADATAGLIAMDEYKMP